MQDLHFRNRRRGSRRDRSALWFAAPLIAVFVIMLAISLAGHKDAGAAPPPEAQLRELRDTQASVELVTALLDRYEREGDREKLHEALHWIDRDWDSQQYRASNVLARVFERDCDEAVSRWHWLCNASE